MEWKSFEDFNLEDCDDFLIYDPDENEIGIAWLLEKEDVIVSRSNKSKSDGFECSEDIVQCHFPAKEYIDIPLFHLRRKKEWKWGPLPDKPNKAQGNAESNV